MIASGTPREVALLEFVPSAKYMKKTGTATPEPSPQEKAKAKLDTIKDRIKK